MGRHDENLGVHLGQVLSGKYALVELLGRGGMGSVWRADHLVLGSPVAVKVIKPAVADHPNEVVRFLREAKAAAALRSPHVVQILDQGVDGDIVFIVMELLEGQTLSERLRRGPPLSLELTATIMTHVGRAVARAHDRGIVHRDLKPDNIFLVRNEDEIVAKVLDFGIAKTDVLALSGSDASPTTETGRLLGTPFYMSPEQATSSKDLDHRCDLWSLGVIGYECVVGERPYRSNSLGDLMLQICTRDPPIPSQHAQVPRGFDAWFQRSQAREPDARFKTARQMAKELRVILVGETRAEQMFTESAPSLDTPAKASVTLPLSSWPDDLSNPSQLSGATFEPLASIRPFRPRWRSRRAALIIGATTITIATATWWWAQTSTPQTEASLDAVASAPASTASLAEAAATEPAVTSAAPAAASASATASASAPAGSSRPPRAPWPRPPTPAQSTTKPPASASPPQPDDVLGI